MQRKCLICPLGNLSAIQKLRVIFPDLLFIRKGQGVTPTAFAMYLYESITQGLESILGALDIEGSYDKQTDDKLLRLPLGRSPGPSCHLSGD